MCNNRYDRRRRALGMRPRWRPQTVKLEPIEELRKQADIAVKVLTVFRGAALLLDEVRRQSHTLPYS